MRKVIRFAVPAVALLLVAAGICFSLRQDDVPQQGGSSAALGMMMLEREKGLYVLAVTQDSLADKAGILPGDYLLCLDDEKLQDMIQLDALMDAAQGPMELLIRRDGQEIPIQLPVK